MTYDGGLQRDGIIFSLDTNGSDFKGLFGFNGAKGNLPYGSLILSGQELYGMTSAGGPYSYGVIFGCDTAGATTSVNNLKAITGSVNVYPNPSNGVFTIGVRDKEQGISEMQVYNMLGEKVYSQFNIQHSTFNINLSNQPNGVYLYRLIDESSELIGEGKLIIQK